MLQITLPGCPAAAESASGAKHGTRSQEEKDEEDTAGPAAQAEKEKVTGLLSRAFHQPPKSLSLHNLLDLQPEQLTPIPVRSHAHTMHACMGQADLPQGRPNVAACCLT